MPCCFAFSRISIVVGPSGMRSTASYHRGFCSAQKYGPVKISCMQRIWTPCRPASSISFRCLSTLAWRIVSIFSLVSHAWVAWIRPHFTIEGMDCLSVGRTETLELAERAGKGGYGLERIFGAESSAVQPHSAGRLVGRGARRGARNPAALWSDPPFPAVSADSLHSVHRLTTCRRDGCASVPDRSQSSRRRSRTTHTDTAGPGSRGSRRCRPASWRRG